MNKINAKIGFIGCGNMGEALIKGLLNKNIFTRNNILASDARPFRARYIQKRYKIKTTLDNSLIAERCNIIILAVKPQNIDETLASIYKEINNNKIIISIAAGITIKHIRQGLPKCRILRAMPNTPALIGTGITAVCKSKSAKDTDFGLAKKIFGSVGDTVEVNEKLMDIVTAVSGSGPAYFFLMIDSIMGAAVLSGMDRKTAEKLVLNTAFGSAALGIKTKQDMKGLIKKVASKGGTTEAALGIFEKYNFKNIIQQAIKAAVKRAKELAK